MIVSFFFHVLKSVIKYGQLEQSNPGAATTGILERWHWRGTKIEQFSRVLRFGIACTHSCRALVANCISGTLITGYSVKQCFRDAELHV